MRNANPGWRMPVVVALCLALLTGVAGALASRSSVRSDAALKEAELVLRYTVEGESLKTRISELSTQLAIAAKEADSARVALRTQKSRMGELEAAVERLTASLHTKGIRRCVPVKPSGAPSEAPADGPLSPWTL